MGVVHELGISVLFTTGKLLNSSSTLPSAQEGQTGLSPRFQVAGYIQQEGGESNS